jgi:prepilin-type N-terminal cleavage/methylation domain-containing protein
MKAERGFTIIEVVVAIVVLTIGVLGLVSTSALVTRMIARGQHSSNGATFAARRVESLRATGCRSQAAGKDTLWTQSGTAIATNSWGFASPTANHWTIVDTVKYQTAQGNWRTDVMESEVSCLF